MVVAIESPQGDHADDQPAIAPTKAAQGTSRQSPSAVSASSPTAATAAML